MAAFVIRRVVHSVFVLWGVITVIFVMMRVVPSDPASLLLGTSATPEEVHSLQMRLGLNQPLVTQYGHYFSGVLRLHFGSSYINGQSATHLVFERATASAYLAVVAAVLSVVVAMPLGILAARYAGRWPDRLITTSSTVAQGPPPGRCGSPVRASCSTSPGCRRRRSTLGGACSPRHAGSRRCCGCSCWRAPCR